MVAAKKNNEPTTISIDTDAFIGLLKADDTHHHYSLQVLDALQPVPVILHTSNYVLSETLTVLSQRVDHAAALSFAERVKAPSSQFAIKWIDEDIEAMVLQLYAHQASKNVSFVDCTNMAYMDHFSLDYIFSFDTTYRKNGYATVEGFVKTE